MDEIMKPISSMPQIYLVIGRQGNSGPAAGILLDTDSTNIFTYICIFKWQDVEPYI